VDVKYWRIKTVECYYALDEPGATGKTRMNIALDGYVSKAARDVEAKPVAGEWVRVETLAIDPEMTDIRQAAYAAVKGREAWAGAKDVIE
jgi:hypothetical protein